jgi:hypothetical protein
LPPRSFAAYVVATSAGIFGLKAVQIMEGSTASDFDDTMELDGVGFGSCRIRRDGMVSQRSSEGDGETAGDELARASRADADCCDNAGRSARDDRRSNDSYCAGTVTTRFNDHDHRHYNHRARSGGSADTNCGCLADYFGSADRGAGAQAGDYHS